MILSDALLQAITSWLEAAYPQEGCGLLLEDDSGQLSFMECANHSINPRFYYKIDSKDILHVMKSPQQLRAVVHSHCDSDDQLSAEDRRVATLGEETAGLRIPGCDQIVVSVIKGVAASLSVWSYDTQRRHFVRAWHKVWPEDLHCPIK